MLKNSGAIAATNGGFFVPRNTGADTIGPVVKNGKLVSYNGSINPNSDSMVSVYEDQTGVIRTAFFHPYLYVQRADGKRVVIDKFNSTFSVGAGLAIYDTTFLTKTYGSEKFFDIVELFVVNGKMMELRENMPATTVPKSGYVIIGTGSDAARLKALFRQGTALTFEALGYSPAPTPSPTPTAAPTATPTATPAGAPAPKAAAGATPAGVAGAEAAAVATPSAKTHAAANATPASLRGAVAALAPTPTIPNFKDMRYCFSGGSYLVKSGTTCTKFTHIPSGSSQYTRTKRTGLGISKDRKKVFIATVQAMSLNAFATHMKSLGAWTAVNFDGGGSTSMSTIDTQVSGRSVVNAIALVPVKPKDGVIVGTKIVASGSVFSGSSTSLSLKAWDRAVAPCKVGAASASFSAVSTTAATASAPPCGEIKNGTFYAKAPGVCTVASEYKGKKSKFQIKVLGKPARLVFGSALLKLAPAEAISVPVKATSTDGFSKALAPSTVKLTTNSNIGQIISAGVLLAGKSNSGTNGTGTGYLTASWKGLNTSLPISIFSTIKKVRDYFSTSKYTLSKTDPATKASFKITQKQLALTYKFPKSDALSRTISLKYKTPVTLPSATKSISLDTTCTTPNTNSIVFVLLDKYKSEFCVLATPAFKSAGRLTISAALPKMTAPVSLAKIDYFEGGCVGDSDVLTFDNLRAIYTAYPSTSTLKLPTASTYHDPAALTGANPPAPPPKTKTQLFNLAICGLSQTSSSQSTAKTRFLAYAQHTTNPYYLGGAKIRDTRDQPYLRVINLDARLGGLAKTSGSQFSYLRTQLASAGSRHLVITLNQAPERWPDSRERDLFYRILADHYFATGRMVTVVAPSATSTSASSSKIEKGVRIISLAPLGASKGGAGSGRYLELRTKPASTSSTASPSFQFVVRKF